MNSIVFHGVPQGHDVFGGSGDKYYESFYGISESYKGAKTVFVVEVRKDVTGFCSYYSYVRPQNVVAHSGRSGSYFGMSLKIDGQYCTDVYSLYQLFDKIYDEKIIGTIIKRAGSTEQYTVASFADAEFQLKSMAQLADNLLNANFENDFEDIDSSFTKQQASTSLYYNLDDVNSEAFFNATKVYGKVFVSQEYASKDAIISTLSSSDKRYQALQADYEKQVAEFQQANTQIPILKSQLSAVEAECADTKKKLQDLQTSYNSVKNSNASLEQQLRRSQQEVEQLKKSSNVGNVAARLEPSLNELLGIMRSVKPSGATPHNYVSPWGQDDSSDRHHSSHHGHQHRGLNPFVFLLIALLVVLALLAAIFFRRGKTAQRERAAIEQQYIDLNKEYSSLQAEVVSLRKNQSFYSLRSKSEKFPAASFELRDESNAVVSEALQFGRQYTVKCTGIDQSGVWRADGFTIQDKNNNPVQIKVNSSDNAILSYYVKDEKALSVEYQVRH